tara:strand:- start:1004 stop:1915 length:912 start_codon:yes stop_codon:yes gene_type:complete
MEMKKAAQPPPGAIGTLASDINDFIVLSEGKDGSPDGDKAQALTAPKGDHFVPLAEIRPNVASHLHVSGPSGCGKSTFANMYAHAFKNCHSGLVYVISADAEPDANLDCVDVRVPIDESLASVKLEDLAGGPGSPPALIIFDDVEGLPKDKAAALRVFEQAVKERGRKMGLHSISIYHRGAANKSTQASLNEATGFVVFPKKMSTNTAYMLKTYAGIPDEVVSLIRRGDWGRWLIVVPGQYLLGERKAAVIDPAVITAIAKAEKKRMNEQATTALAKAVAEQENKGGAAVETAMSKLSGLGYR